jgi:tetratricopeptide (TPR) repeat protein
MNKPGRNDTCPCGSGKKYKKCCLPKEEAQQLRQAAALPRGGGNDSEEPFITELRPDVDDKVDRVLARLESGAGREVEPELKALLKEYPGYHMTHYAMGVYIAMVMDDARGSIPFFERAVQILPPFPQAHFNLGAAASKTADVARAFKGYRAAMRYSQAGDGIAEMARKELKTLERILLKDSTFPSVDAYLANAALFDEAFQRLAAQDFERAAELFSRVLSENPTHVQSFGNLALANAGMGRKAAALECFDRALALDPSYEPAMTNRRIVEKMREGIPFIPDGMQEIYYYAERLQRER